ASYEHLWGPLRLFRFVTFRTGGAAFTAMALTFILGPLTVRLLKRFNTVAPPRLEGLVPDEHLTPEKNSTPSMGGLLIIFSITVSALLWGVPWNPLLIVFLVTMLALAAVGFLDDYSKVKHKKRDGISGRAKLLFQFIIASCAIGFLFILPETSDLMWHFMVPFLKDPVFTGTYGAVFSVVVGILAVMGASNAVNLTDGKDGLAVGCVICCALTYAVFAYFCGHRIFAEYLRIPYIPGAGEVAVLAAAMGGASIGFLWFNCHPATMFMGDTGSLALGGTIALIAVLVKQELTLILVGGVFVMEAGSVIIQVASMKLTGKRVFLCTPIHHHFERKNWDETQIVVRFWILSAIFALFALATLKLR
ncbi:MAG: phospho-N-acetylmuramoyl-pentapeptide-transferase, partial [Victivallales bacterium]|nr:phospho-N-acetylmuramoyl-pentapeptide-transferase [Victivallales bacterium]